MDFFCTHQKECPCYVQAQRTVCLRLTEWRFKGLRNRQPITARGHTRPVPRRRFAHRRPRWARLSARPTLGPSLCIRPSLLDALLEAQATKPIEYHSGTARYRTTMHTRQLLSERNPYGIPAEGLTHKLRLALGVVKRAMRERELSMPLHQKPNFVFRQKCKVNTLLGKYLTSAQVTPIWKLKAAIRDEVPVEEGLDDQEWQEILEDRKRVGDVELWKPRRKDAPQEEEWFSPRTVKKHVLVDTFKEIERTRILIRHRTQVIADEKLQHQEYVKAFHDAVAHEKKENKRLNKMYLAEERKTMLLLQRITQMEAQREKSDRDIAQMKQRIEILLFQIKRLVEACTLCRAMRFFLMKISPPSWAKKQGDFPDMSRPLLNCPVEEATEDDLKQVPKELKCEKHALYFKRPCRIIEVLEKKRIENAESLELVNSTELLITVFQNKTREFKEKCKNEVEELRERVADMKKRIRREVDYIAEMKLTIKKYTFGMSSKSDSLEREIIFLNELLESCSEEIFGKVDPLSDAVYNIRKITNLFLELSETMAALPKRHVQRAIHYMRAKGEQILMEHKIREKRRRQCLRLLDRLKTMLKPPPPKENVKPLKPRSLPPIICKRKVRRVAPEKEVVPENEDLDFFIDSICV